MAKRKQRLARRAAAQGAGRMKKADREKIGTKGDGSIRRRMDAIKVKVPRQGNESRRAARKRALKQYGEGDRSVFKVVAPKGTSRRQAERLGVLKLSSDTSD